MKKILSSIIIGLLCFSMFSILTLQVKADSKTIIFQDDFETYTVGSFPSAGGWELIWNGKGTQYQIITDTVSHSLTKSLQLWGRPSWSANVQREFTSSSEILGYEVYVRTASNTGMYHNIASVCFWNLSGLAWGKRFADTWFGQDGEIYTRPVSGSPFIPLGLTYEAHRWYKVRVVVDRTAETYNVWIDDIIVAQDVGIWDTNEIEALMLQSGHAEVKAYFDDAKVFEGAPSAATLTVNVFDESGFPPASSGGARRLVNVPVKIYTLDDILVANGITDASGTVSFNLAEGSYKIVYGGRAKDPRGGSAYGVASKIVDVFGSSVSIDLYCFQVTFHSYEAGGPYELNYVDLNRSTVGYQEAITVQPGEQINAEFSWWELETINVPVWYVSVFGSWSEMSALGNLKSGVASPSTHRLHTIPLSFDAPTMPGTYGVRLVGVLDYTWPNSYYTGAHYNPSLGRDMGIGIIGKGIDEPYGIGTIIVGVVNQPPVAEFTYSPTYPDIYEKVNFDASASYDPDGGTIVSYEWNFGDGSSESDMITNHKYRSEGIYEVTLTVTDDEGQTGVTSVDVVVMLRMYYELYLEIDYMEGHAPSEEALAYIKDFFRTSTARAIVHIIPPEEISLEEWHEIDSDERTTHAEFEAFESTYNHWGDDAGFSTYTSKYKWILFGAEWAANPYYNGLTHFDPDARWVQGRIAYAPAGNYIFIAHERINEFANENGLLPEEVETKTLMHELGHSIGIWMGIYHSDSNTYEEMYDNNPFSVMTRADPTVYTYNDEIDETYSPNYWRLKSMHFYEL